MRVLILLAPIFLGKAYSMPHPRYERQAPPSDKSPALHSGSHEHVITTTPVFPTPPNTTIFRTQGQQPPAPPGPAGPPGNPPFIDASLQLSKLVDAPNGPASGNPGPAQQKPPGAQNGRPSGSSTGPDEGEDDYNGAAGSSPRPPGVSGQNGTVPVVSSPEAPQVGKSGTGVAALSGSGNLTKIEIRPIQNPSAEKREGDTSVATQPAPATSGIGGGGNSVPSASPAGNASKPPNITVDSGQQTSPALNTNRQSSATVLGNGTTQTSQLLPQQPSSNQSPAQASQVLPQQATNNQSYIRTSDPATGTLAVNNGSARLAPAPVPFGQPNAAVVSNEKIAIPQSPQKEIKSTGGSSGYRSRCPYKIPPDAEVPKKCGFELTKSRNLDIFSGHNDVSICEMMVANREQCEFVCGDVEECKAVHFCSECVEHNCRLLKEPKGGPSKLALVDRYDYVDYSEKGNCSTAGLEG